MIDNGLASAADLVPLPVLRHGAYVCVRPTGQRDRLATAPVEALVTRLDFSNEFEATGHPDEAVAFLRRIDVADGQIPDERVSHAEAIVHVASPSSERIDRFCTELTNLLRTDARLAVLQGVVRPPTFTSAAMHDFAYARQRQQQPGHLMPDVFIVPMSKTPQWWAKTWMERHTYFLPSYDEHGRMRNEGHALAGAAGIPHLMRRTYKHATLPAPEGEYDFVNYFECADAGVAIFLDVLAALRDETRNPEWQYVREGPLWRGRRVRAWSDLGLAQAR